MRETTHELLCIGIQPNFHYAVCLRRFGARIWYHYKVESIYTHAKRPNRCFNIKACHYCGHPKRTLSEIYRRSQSCRFNCIPGRLSSSSHNASVGISSSSRLDDGLGSPSEVSCIGVVSCKSAFDSGPSGTVLATQAWQPRICCAEFVASKLVSS